MDQEARTLVRALEGIGQDENLTEISRRLERGVPALCAWVATSAHADRTWSEVRGSLTTAIALTTGRARGVVERGLVAYETIDRAIAEGEALAPASSRRAA